MERKLTAILSADVQGYSRLMGEDEDKTWSFTDCTTKVVMDSFSIQHIFAFDHHFEQMGFIRFPT